MKELTFHIFKNGYLVDNLVECRSCSCSGCSGNATKISDLPVEAFQTSSVIQNANSSLFGHLPMLGNLENPTESEYPVIMAALRPRSAAMDGIIYNPPYPFPPNKRVTATALEPPPKWLRKDNGKNFWRPNDFSVTEVL